MDHEFQHSHWKNAKVLRAMEYSLPFELDEHISYVFQVTDFPVPMHGNPILDPMLKALNSSIVAKAAGSIYAGYVTPQLIKQTYGMLSNTGNVLTSQAVFSTIEQTLSPSDLSSFQSYFGFPQQSIATAIGGHVRNDACTYTTAGLSNCAEANLDFQYLMSTAQGIPTTSYYTDAGWLSWITSVSNMTDPPKIFSISYSSPEQYVSLSTINSFNTEAMKLGVMGVTLLVASGDDGVGGRFVRSGALTCAYNPDFPTVSPYLTVVGATQMCFDIIVVFLSYQKTSNYVHSGS